MSTPTMLDRYQTSVGYFARITHRLSGILIAIYMLVYLWELSSVVRGGVASFDATMAAYDTLFWRLTHVLVVALVVLHALTGLRVMLLESGLGLRIQKASFWLSLVLTLALFLLLFIKMIDGLAV